MRIYSTRMLKLFLFLLVFVVFIRSVSSQSTKQNSTSTQPLSEQVIQDRLKTALATEGLSEETKTKLKSLYDEALNNLEQIKKYSDEAKTFELMASPVEIAENQAEIKRSMEEIALAKDKLGKDSLSKDIPIKDLEKLLKQKEEKLALARKKLAEKKAEPDRRKERLKEISEFKIQETPNLKKLEDLLKAPPPPGEPPALTLARKTQQQTKLDLLKQKLGTFELEEKAYSATDELLQKERDLALQEVDYLEGIVNELATLVPQRRNQVYQEDINRIRKELQKAPEPLRSLLKTNLTLAESLLEISKDVDSATNLLRDQEAELAKWQELHKKTKLKVENTAVSNALGLLLRKHRAQLPDISSLRQQIALRESKLFKVQQTLLQLQEQRDDLVDIEEQSKQLVEEVQAIPMGFTRSSLQRKAAQLLQEQKDYLGTIIRHQDTYFDKLLKLNTIESQLKKEAQAYRSLIDERILWIRSTTTLSLSDFRQASRAFLWLFSPKTWYEVGNELALDAKEYPFRAAFFAILFIGWLICQRPLRKKIKKIGEQAHRGSCQEFNPTIQAFFLTFLIAGIWPSLLWLLSWRLQSSVEASETTRTLGYGFMQVAKYFFGIELFRQFCRPRGLGNAHFGWREPICANLRSLLTYYIFIGLPLVFVCQTFSTHVNLTWNNSLGRMCCIVLLITLAIFAHFILRPNGPIIKRYVALNKNSWLCRSRYLWYGLFFFGPLVMVVLAFLGYYFTTTKFLHHVESSVGLLASLLILNSLLMRWLLIGRRRVAFRQYQERQEAEEKEEEVEESDGFSPSEIATINQPEIDLSSINEQTRKLVNLFLTLVGVVGLTIIWLDVIPGLGILDSVVIWQVSIGNQLQNVTLLHLAISLLFAAITFIAIKNLPGLLELILLQRLSLDAGARYALITILRYLLFITGAIFALGILGIRWSQYQWLVAAATVGLGFGLQEIFANFVSGLIVLLERPIRVGDIITIGDVTGSVSRISLRAIVITNWDRQEFVVPNKDIVTGRVLNWTLSNSIYRLVIPVGISYSDNPDRAKELLLQIARNSPSLVQDPPPNATFESFDDSSLRVVLRCYLPNLDRLLSSRHEICSAIWRTFKQEGIEIAFPQRDLHIRSTVEPVPRSETKELNSRQGAIRD